jgi:hypothetical protein
MTSLMFILMMQFVVSTKAGLVNYVQGSANVKATTTVPAGSPIETGAAGAVEILLNPGSYLRLGENSRAVLEQVELAEISMRITRGSAVIEANGFDRKTPLKVTSGNLKMEIIDDGIYSFSDGKVLVVNGKIRNADTRIVYKKGYQISDDAGYLGAKVKTIPTPLEAWSRKRSELIAAANVNVVNSLRKNPNIPLNSFLDVWMWAPAFGAFVFMPGYSYRSPYGYSYQSVGYYGPGQQAGGFSNPAQANAPGNSGGAFGNGGGASAGGGGGSAGVSASRPSSSPAQGSGARPSTR